MNLSNWKSVLLTFVQFPSIKELAAPDDKAADEANIEGRKRKRKGLRSIYTRVKLILNSRRECATGR